MCMTAPCSRHPLLHQMGALHLEFASCFTRAHVRYVVEALTEAWQTSVSWGGWLRGPRASRMRRQAKLPTTM